MSITLQVPLLFQKFKISCSAKGAGLSHAVKNNKKFDSEEQQVKFCIDAIISWN